MIIARSAGGKRMSCPHCKMEPDVCQLSKDKPHRILNNRCIACGFLRYSHWDAKDGRIFCPANTKTWQLAQPNTEWKVE